MPEEKHTRKDIMKIGPCKDEITMNIVLSLLTVVMFGVLFYQMIAHPVTPEMNPHVADHPNENAYFLAFTLFGFVLCEALIFGSILYFGRSITLDAEGCRFSFRGFEKKFRWEELDVQYYENLKHSYLSSCLSNREADGPGILINVKGRKYNPKRPAMAYCYTFHPMTSVFLRFRGPKDDLKSWKYNNTVVGYTLKREELLAVLEELGHCPEVPEIQYRR